MQKAENLLSGPSELLNVKVHVSEQATNSNCMCDCLLHLSSASKQNLLIFEYLVLL